MSTAHDDALEAATREADRLAQAAIELRNAYQFSRRLKVGLTVGAIALILQAVIGVALIALATQNHTLARSTSETLAVVKDCTDPNGRCAQRGKQSQGQAIALIVAQDVNALIVVTECARQTTTDPALEACVANRLANKH